MWSRLVEAFEVAHDVSSAIPKLRLAHTRKLARRLSKLPPPPMPMPRTDARPRALTVPERVVITDAGDGGGFQGNFGKRTH